MNVFPPLPPVEGLHPLVVHFPIALLTLVPIALALSLFSRLRRRMALSAAGLLVLGTLGTILAVASGEWGEGAAERVVAAESVLESHEELAEFSRSFFLGLSALYLVWLGLGRAKLEMTLGRTVQSGFFALSLIGVVALARTAHEGGRLVHELGVHAPMTPSAVAPAANGAGDDASSDDS